MSQLVAELKLEHREIVQTLEEVNRLGIGTKEGQDKLLSVKYNLLAHLDKEDKKMYPKLSKAAENDQNLRQTLGFYTTKPRKFMTQHYSSSLNIHMVGPATNSVRISASCIQLYR